MNYYYISDIKTSDEQQFLLLVQWEECLSVRKSGLELREEKVSILKPAEHRQLFTLADHVLWIHHTV